MPVHILGLNAHVHASAAALMADGQVIAAAQEERFVREKYSGRFPEMAIRYCLDEAGLDPSGLDAVAYYWKPWKGLLDRALIILRAVPHSLALFEHHDLARGGPKTVLDHACLQRTLKLRTGIKCPVYFVEHQLCHASSAFYPSGFDTAAVLSLDLAGEIDSTLAAIGEGTRLTPLWVTKYPHSVGHFYGAITQYLGFRPNADEYRVMALAAYGADSHYPLLKELVALLPDGQFRLDLRYFVHHWGQDTWYSARLVDLLGPPRDGQDPLSEGRFANIAFAAQRLCEDICLHVARALRKRTGRDRLCLAGGVALNGVMNHCILGEEVFREVFVPPCPNDPGTAVGAPLFVWHSIMKRVEKHVQSAYLGPQYSTADIEKACASRRLRFRRCCDPAKEGAQAIAAGNVMGWYQGRMEFGQRALGNRSILADPRCATMKERMNQKVKFRETFRPFGGSVPEEVFADYFDMEDPSPYMLQVCTVKPEIRCKLPAITHVDGTCRPQTVAKSDNVLFWSLLRQFEGLTGVPVVVNTSFNRAGEPIVCSPEDAIACFLETGIDVLIMGDYVLRKEDAVLYGD